MADLCSTLWVKFHNFITSASNKGLIATNSSRVSWDIDFLVSSGSMLVSIRRKETGKRVKKKESEKKKRKERRTYRHVSHMLHSHDGLVGKAVPYGPSNQPGLLPTYQLIMTSPSFQGGWRGSRGLEMQFEQWLVMCPQFQKEGACLPASPCCKC